MLSFNKRVSTNFIACLVLLVSGFLIVTSSWDDSPTYDEPEHITAGYGCLIFRDCRANVWHPPLIKVLSAIPLWLADVKFPLETYKRDYRSSFYAFFFESGNDPQTIMRIARIAPIGLALVFALLFYLSVKKIFSPAAAIIALIMFALSPTFIAHSRFVHSDVAVTGAFYGGIVGWIYFIRSRTFSSFLLSVFLTFLALMTKFSALAIIPFYGILAVTAACVMPAHKDLRGRFLEGVKLSGYLGGLLLLSFFLVAVSYNFLLENTDQYFMSSYQASFLQKNQNSGLFEETVPVLHEVPALRGLGWFATGLSRVIRFLFFDKWLERSYIYLLGHVAHDRNPHQFLILVLAKEAVGFLCMFALAAWFFLKILVQQGCGNLRTKIAANFYFFGFALFVTYYSCISFFPYNVVGQRYFLPVFPFLCALCGSVLDGCMAANIRLKRLTIGLSVFILVEILAFWPDYLSFFNVAAKSWKQPYEISIDSNLDWGSGLLRLRKYLDKNNLPSIYLYYYGPIDPKFYLGDKFRKWGLHDPRPDGLIAISVSLFGLVDAYWDSDTGKRYSLPDYLKGKKPIDVVGGSIMIFKPD